jgi:hypothetical protein
MAFTATILTGDRTCINRLPGGSGTASVVIKAAVGDAPPPRCMNFSDDVRTIQNALNRFTPLHGGPAPPLVPDGICGPLTRGAILHFQKKWDLTPKHSKVPDGIVDTNGPTIERLRKGPETISNLPAEFMGRIPRVIGVITASRAALDLARRFLQRPKVPNAPSPIPTLDLIGEAEARMVDRHFHVTKIANPLARLGQVDEMFLNMLTAIGHVPQGLVLAADEPPSMAVGSFMFTFAGGYHARGKNDTFDGIPVASVYLCPKARTLNQDAFTYAMIHELAHFTGPIVNGVTDHAYFHKSPQLYRALTPELAFRNADSYSQFAFQAIGKPDFNIAK